MGFASVLLPFCFWSASVMQVKVHVMEVPCLAGFPQISTCSSNQFAAPVCFRSASVFRRSLRASSPTGCHVRDVPCPGHCRVSRAAFLSCFRFASVVLPFCFRYASKVDSVRMCRETAKEKLCTGVLFNGSYIKRRLYIKHT